MEVQQVGEAEDQLCQKCQITVPVRGLCICSVFGHLSPFLHRTQNHMRYTVCTVYPEFKHWMSKGILSVTASSVRYVYICYRWLLSSDSHSKESFASFNTDSIVWAQNYASVVVDDYWSSMDTSRLRVLLIKEQPKSAAKDSRPPPTS